MIRFAPNSRPTVVPSIVGVVARRAIGQRKTGEKGAVGQIDTTNSGEITHREAFDGGHCRAIDAADHYGSHNGDTVAQ